MGTGSISGKSASPSNSVRFAPLNRGRRMNTYCHLNVIGVHEWRSIGVHLSLNGRIRYFAPSAERAPKSA